MTAYIAKMRAAYNFYNELNERYALFANALPSPKNVSEYQQLFSNIPEFLNMVNSVYLWHISRPNINIPIVKSPLFKEYSKNVILGRTMINFSNIPSDYYIQNYKSVMQLIRSSLGEFMTNTNRSVLNALTSVANIHTSSVKSPRSRIPSIASSVTSRRRPSQNSNTGSFVSARNSIGNNWQSFNEGNTTANQNINVGFDESLQNNITNTFSNNGSNNDSNNNLNNNATENPQVTHMVKEMVQIFDGMVVDLHNRFEKPMKCKIPLPKVFGKPSPCASEKDLQRMEECKTAVAYFLKQAVDNRNLIYETSSEIQEQQIALLVLFSQSLAEIPTFNSLRRNNGYRNYVNEFIHSVFEFLNAIESTESCMAFTRLENFIDNVGKRRAGQLDRFTKIANEFMALNQTGGKKKSNQRKTIRKRRQMKRQSTRRN